MTKSLTSDQYDTHDHEDYLNFVLECSSRLTPSNLYIAIKEIEDNIGHSRQNKWLPRKLDIDILFFALNDHKDFKQCTPRQHFDEKLNLLVPHEGFWNRDFLMSLTIKELDIPASILKNHSQDIYDGKECF